MRRWYRTDLIIIGLMIFLMSASAVFAQRPDKGMRGKRGWGKHAENLENLRMLKLLEVIDLDEEQNVEFLALFASSRKKMKEIREEMESEVDELIEILKDENPDESLIKEKLGKIEVLKKRFTDNFENLQNKAKEILTTVQYAKMLVFQERFERELIQSVKGFRNNPPPDMGP
ncbi:MAG: hypothetical protein DRP46_06720 [Candidatus Zixiibacteriota bacterium]|nr:MAG: hypothetical protein DRP46_06720 [candidate division Zixibacteria bacterium]